MTLRELVEIVTHRVSRGSDSELVELVTQRELVELVTQRVSRGSD